MGDRGNARWEDGDTYEARQERLEAFAAKLKMRPEDVEVFVRNGFEDMERIPKHPVGRRALLKYLKKHETPPATWVVISGLWPEVEPGLLPADRRVRVRAVYKAAVLMIRRELKRHEADPMKAERGLYWEPVGEVCRALQIAPSKLSKFCQELTGNSLAQVIDNVKAEGLRKKLRAGVREFLRTHGAGLGTENHSVSRKDAKEKSFPKNGKGVKWEVWEGLKEERKWPEFTRDTWAMGFGFSSYRKMYRACLCIYGKTPHQLEMEGIELALDESGEEGEEKGDVAGDGFKEWTLEEIQQEIKGIRADDWLEDAGVM